MYQTLQVRSGQPHETPEMLQAADGDANAKPTEGDVARNPGARAEPPILALPSYIEGTNQASVVPLVSDASGRSQDSETTDSPKPQHHAQPSPEHYDESSVSSMMRQPATRHVSKEQLVEKVEDIYKTLAQKESECIDGVRMIRGEQSSGQQQTLSDKLWQLGDAHESLLNEHFDFFYATNHPAADDPLRELVSKHSMLQRMWRHGIQSYIELLRSQVELPLEQIFNHISLSSGILEALYEAVPSYAKNWSEWLGDLARYRMAFADSDADRGIWTEASRGWYEKTSDLSPGTGRLYHHLAVLARPDRLQQLFYYSKSLCVLDPFEKTRNSILTLFEKACNPDNMQQPTDPLIDPLVQCHGHMFMHTGEQDQRFHARKFLSLLDNRITQAADLLFQSSYTIGIANCCAMVEYGSMSNIILQIINGEPDDTVVVGTDGPEESGDSTKSSQLTAEFVQARDLAFATAQLMLNRLDDSNVWPFLHIMLVFVYNLSRFREKGGMTHVEEDIPWSSLVNHLNAIRPSGAGKDDSDSFPGCTPLAEDFAMRGLPWAAKYHPDGWFGKAEADDAKTEFEMASGSVKRLILSEERRVRILWLARRIADCKRWIRYDSEGGTFSDTPEFVDAEYLVAEEWNMV